MALPAKVAAFLRSIFHKQQLEDDLDDELRTYIDELTKRKIGSGEDPATARRNARIEAGGIEQIKEEVRGERVGVALETFLRDVGYACRGLRRNPGFAFVAILTLAIGIGANAAIFSVVDTVILRPLTYRDAGDLVVIDEATPRNGRLPVNATHFDEWRRSARSFEAMSLIGGMVVNLTGSGEPERVPAARVSPSLFPMLGIQAQLGRTLLEEEDQPGRDHVVLISSDLWKRRFAADRSIVGKTIVLDNEPYDVVGVLPADFHFPRLSQLYAMTIAGRRPELWKPFALKATETTPVGDYNYASIGRLKPGVSMAAAQSELHVVMGRIRSQFRQLTELDAAVVPLQDQMAGRSRTALELVFAAVCLVLLIGCVNIANLLLTKMSARRREFAIRAAIGASRSRLIRQMTVETLVLSGLGGTLGIVVAYGAIALILAVAPDDVPRIDEIHMDARVFLFAFTISIVTGLLIGLLPALRLARRDLSASDGIRLAHDNRKPP